MVPWTNEILLLIACAFSLAGFVKGVVGFGLPTVALAVMAIATGAVEAMVLMLAPSLVTNAWQALAGGHLKIILRRFWSFLLLMAAGILFASGLLAAADARALSGMLGIALVLYGAISLAGPQVPSPGRREIWLTPVVGLVNGIITGLTGTFVVPSVLYLQSLRLTPGLQVQAMGVFFFTATCVLGIGLAGHGLMGGSVSWLSIVAVAPALAGMWLGARLRKKLDAGRFRKVFFCAVTVVGGYLVVKGFVFA
ncbi:MAG: sulfite exporter TauE/SafE family protein [Rhodospirillaceae bacterium]|mgnify:CR=1 FL=1|jgi:uncharacterized protein|nr:sulfite exporter TauE/SafE family protein [Rhodospirillaceae bacterium]MBT6512323.1 sulfite exporter TauE/SafE family protein [Rhodospirillaceae bacterium]MBT7647125.1 sulfite exporter TauE/SafE family protein [Rhodospirillaceae bacterium]